MNACINHHKLEPFSSRERWYLVGITIVGGIIRLLYHYDRPFVGDEVGTILYMERSIPYLLSHFESWLTMNYFIILEKMVAVLTSDPDFALSIIPLVAAIAAIPLTAFLAHWVTSTRVSTIAATLVAMNPYLILFSGIIRAYSLLTALSLAVTILFFKWFSTRTIRNGLYVSGVCFLLMLCHLNGAYTLAYIMFLTGADWIARLRSHRQALLSTLIIPLFASLLLAGIAYVGMLPDILEWGTPWHDTPPTDISHIPYVFSQYFSSGYFGWPSMILLVTAVCVSIKRDMPLLILLPYLAITITLISIQGISHFPWAYGRFMSFLVPILIIVISEGIHYYASLLGTRSGMLGTAAVTLLLVSWLPNFGELLQRKVDYPWHQVASSITSDYEEGDVILYGSWEISHNLFLYFRDPRFRTASLTEYTDESSTNAGGLTYVITSERPLTTDHPKRVFGNIQVTIYPHDAFRQSLVSIRDDFVSSMEPDEITPGLTEFYRNIWEMNRRLGEDDKGNFRYYQLYMFCLRLTERQRWIPRSLQIVETEALLSVMPSAE